MSGEANKQTHSASDCLVEMQVLFGRIRRAVRARGPVLGLLTQQPIKEAFKWLLKLTPIYCINPQSSSWQQSAMRAVK